MSDTDLLLRAAAHVRYLAGDPAEWDMDTNNLTTFEVHEQDERGWWSRLIGRSLRPTRALHVAAWDPKTTHLIADWMESVADLHEPPMRPPGCQWCTDEDWPCSDTRHALAVARALLGEDSE